MQHSKRYRLSTEKLKKDALPLAEAVAAVKASATAKFDETIELAANLGIDPRHADQQVRGTINLPKGTGKTVRVAVFAAGEDAEAATQAGADVVGAEDLAEKIQGGFLDFDVTLATPDMMRHVGKLGRVLGPRGLMPNPKTGTVTKDIAKAVEEFKGGKIEYRANREGILHVPVGKASFEVQDLLENVRAMIRTIIRARPSAAKGTYIRSLTLSSTMGPGIRIDPADAFSATREA